jgi:hypothetical protein
LHGDRVGPAGCARSDTAAGGPLGRAAAIKVGHAGTTDRIKLIDSIGIGGVIRGGAGVGVGGLGQGTPIGGRDIVRTLGIGRHTQKEKKEKSRKWKNKRVEKAQRTFQYLFDMSFSCDFNHRYLPGIVLMLKNLGPNPT